MVRVIACHCLLQVSGNAGHANVENGSSGAGPSTTNRPRRTARINPWPTGKQCCIMLMHGYVYIEVISYRFLFEHDYVTFRSLLSHIRLSVICNVHTPYSGC